MIPELFKYDIPFSELEAKVLSWAQESLELAYGEGGDPEGTLPDYPPLAEGAYPLTEFLKRVVQRVDRVDELYSKATQARARARRAKDQASFDAQVAYDTAMRDNQGRRASIYVTREEKNADATLDSLEEKRVAHHADRLVSVTQEAYDVISQCHWFLEGKRKDVNMLLKALSFERSIER